ncbi:MULTISPECIES: hypothetical protein [unclassified Sphingomonas]|jgi:hypothetical protein|uniref:hypothetical protein n=1 Tax=unclassified Sphingomonas TaxID=196159 RepID=UPI0025F23F45|nr:MULTISPECIES: hypothetical protein [unclassified Sphingomonas]
MTMRRVIGSASGPVGLTMMDEQAATAELHRLLTLALETADRLDLTMIAIHIDEARNLLAENDAAANH